MNGGHPIEVNLNITVRLSDGLEQQLERLIALLVTAQHKWEEDNEDED
jgi:hypothetical protein